MGKLKYEKVAANVKVEKVETTFEVVGGARRNHPAGEVHQTGYFRSNVEGGELLAAYFDEQGIDPKEPWVILTASKSLGTVFMHAAKQTDEGAVAVKYDENNKTYVTHFGAAFKQFPTLQPTTKVEGRLKPSLDPEGRPCIAVKVKGAPSKRKGAATLEQIAARAEDEAAKQAEKAAVKQRIAAARQGKAQAKPPTEEQE